MDVIGDARRRVGGLRMWPADWGPVWSGRCAGPAGFAGWLAAASGLGGAEEALGGLVVLAQSGDRLAPVVLVAVLGDGLRSVARRMGYSADPVGEVVSEFVEVLYGWDVRRCPAQWLVRAVRRQVLMRHRREVRGAELTMLAAEPVAASRRQVSDHQGVEGMSAVMAVTETLTAAGLSSRDAETVVATRVWGMGLEELADRRGVSRWVLYKQRARAEARVRAVLSAA